MEGSTGTGSRVSGNISCPSSVIFFFLAVNLLEAGELFVGFHFESRLHSFLVSSQIFDAFHIDP